MNQITRLIKKAICLSLAGLLLLMAAAGCAADGPGSGTSAGDSSPSGFVLPAESHYQVVVAGGEPEGIAAALAAARSGKKTLLLEKGPVLGGLWTLGWLNFFDMNEGADGELLTQGIFKEFYDALGDAFDVDEAAAYFAEVTAKEPLLDVALNTGYGEPVLQPGAEASVLTALEIGERKVYAERFIDATADADLSAASGVPFTLGAEDYGRAGQKMAVTLVFKVKGVRWGQVFLYNNWQRLLNRLNRRWGDAQAGAKSRLAWGYGASALSYVPQDPLTRFRGPNLARQKNGDVLINALLIFDVDPLDAQSLNEGIRRGQAEIPYIIEYMRQNFAGFGNAKLAGTAPRLYVRESRHILGAYRLTITDVLENRDQWDRIAQGSYPVDLQSSQPDDLGDVIGKPEIFSIPFRCLVPLGVDNLLTVGRSASFDSLAHGSARVVPVGVAAGEAAGTAAALSLDQQVTFRQMSRSEPMIQALQQELVRRGAHLEEFQPPRIADMDHWAYDGLAAMRALGLASGGYANQYNLDGTAEYWDIRRILSRVGERIRQIRPEAPLSQAVFDDTPLTRRDMLSKAAAMLQLQPGPDPAEALIQAGILTEDILAHMVPLEQKPSFGELYWLGARIYEHSIN